MNKQRYFLSGPEDEPEEPPQYDGTGIYKGEDSSIWYDTEGDQHVETGDQD